MSKPDYDAIVMSDAVLEHHWDSGCLGSGAGVERLHYFQGEYWQSGDAGVEGPYRSMEHAIAQSGILMINDATTAITCRQLKSEELGSQIDTSMLESPHRVLINGEQRVFEPRRRTHS